MFNAEEISLCFVNEAIMITFFAFNFIKIVLYFYQDGVDICDV